MGWERWTGDRGAIVAVDHYGASAPFEKIYSEYGLTPAHIVEKALNLLSELESQKESL